MDFLHNYIEFISKSDKLAFIAADNWLFGCFLPPYNK